MRYTLHLDYRKKLRKYLRWYLRSAWIIVNISVNIYDNDLGLLYAFDPGECLRVGRTVSGWARSGSFCDRNFCRQLTNFFGQSHPWPLVCGLSTIRLSQPPWWTVFSNRGLVWACCQLWLFENFYDYLHSFFRWSCLPCKSTRASSRLNIICWVSENCCSKTPG